MKIKHLFMAVLACAAFAACEKTPVNGPEVDGALTETSYLSIKISNVPETRAPEDAAYEDGIAAENTVNHVRFYFFDATGNAAKVIAPKEGTGATGYVNYFDWTPETQGTDPSIENVKKLLDAVVVINTKVGDLLPAQMAAVVNASATSTSLSLTELRNVVADYSSTTNGFVMASSTYKKGTERLDAVKLLNTHFARSAEDAKKAPVDIYVERVLAKVRVEVKMGTDVETQSVTINDKAETIYYTGMTSDKSTTATDDNKVYVKFLGWDVTTTTSKSYLVKNINPAWTDNLFTAWNYDPYFRSYWAVNPTGDNAPTLQYYTFNEIKAKQFGTDVDYCQENASNNFSTGVSPDLGDRTQVIIAAQLVKKDGTTIQLVDWQGFRYTAETIKTAILAAVKDQGYTTTLVDSDITFKTPIDLGEAYGHEVFAQLADAYTGKVISGEGDSAKELDKNAINKILKDLGQIKYWNNGYTYYYKDIAHLIQPAKETETEAGKWGVVRNHIYDIDITKVTGLGTPVYDPSELGTDPEEDIIPEKPEYDESYLAARINILSWRVVNQNVELN